MASNIREFELELDGMFDITMEQLREKVMELAFDGDAILRRRSPVDTGQFRANWVTSVGEPITAMQVGPGGGFEATSLAAIADYPKDAWPVIYMANNVPYAEALEDGHSKFAPLGVVAETKAELAAEWESKTL